uniref:Lanthionine synthetase C family protein n=1 Tax=Rubinisphaera brasiliensis (strain ATCC 49424 / DSM 5305 / JCM 21570 / IAM 15109 / NBRC 103401 / IFAM 1448) TaxID=756272 RepID=F0SR42_RUBBR|nr:Lanthionine synthetase C family protein [Rubinisphaera brasiliensis DSM 5305]
MTDCDLHSLVWRAMTIRERLSAAPELGGHAGDDADSTLTQWCQEVANGDRTLFEERLSWLPGQPSNLGTILQDLPPRDYRVPDWAGHLGELIALTREGGSEEPSGFPARTAVEVHPDFPFVPLFGGAMRLARCEIARRLGPAGLNVESALAGWTETAWLDLETSLLRSLIGISTKTLNEVFLADLPFGLRALKKIGFTTATTAKTERYERFVQTQLGDGLAGLFEEYPVLARLLCLRIDHWASSIIELLLHYRADAEEIGLLMEASAPTVSSRPAVIGGEARVVGVRTGLSDPHDGGRSVCVLEFAQGRRVVYKPRSLQCDAAFQSLLSWINSIDASWDFRELKLLERDGYGWCEYIAPEDCDRLEEVRRFYERAGGLTALCYALNATDLHHENIIAVGSQALLIDLETLFAPRTFKAGFTRPELTANPAGDSILQTGLFPQWAVSQTDLVSFDVGGLTGGGGTSTPITVRRWSHPNTDDMALLPFPMTQEESDNVPRYQGQRQAAWKYVAEFHDGFDRMYRLLVAHRYQLLDPLGPLAGFRAAKVRVILRDTQVYASLLDENLEPRVLTSGVKWSIKLDSLVRPLLRDSERRCWGPIADDELTQLERLDIPRLVASSDGLVEREGLDGLPEPSCFDQVLQRVRRLDLDRDLRHQQDLAHALLSSRSGRNPPSPTIDIHALEAEASVDLRSEALLQEATAIGDVILEHALHDRNGDVYWLGGVAASKNTHEGRLEFGVTDMALYEGRAGTAVFLAALAAATGNTTYADAALETLRPVTRLVERGETSRQSLVNELPLGGVLGVGSLIYSLVRCGEFLQRDDLRQSARSLAAAVPLHRILGDADLDIMKGVAGLSAALLTTYRSTGDTTSFRLAIHCGNRLLQARVPTASKRRAWRIPTEGRPLTGFSHGAAGIAYALTELFDGTGNEDYVIAAGEAIAFENEHFVSASRNWEDLRSLNGKSSRQPRTLSMWCNGAVGIGLGRLSALGTSYSQDRWHADVDTAIETVQKSPLSELDHCCCGHFGRIELLIEAAEVLSRPRLIGVAHEHVASVLRRATEAGYRISSGDAIRAAVNPAFFTGLSGIGYQLLRLTEPSRFPSVLTLQ